MGKPIIAQRRGKGSPSFRAHSHKFKSDAKYKTITKTEKAEIIDFIDDPGKSNILAKLKYENGTENLVPASEGIFVGELIGHGPEALLMPGSIIPLKNIPEGFPVFNVESRPGDGGKLVKSTGNCGYIISKGRRTVNIKMPSRKIKTLNEKCMATIGCAAGGGRTEKPLLTAGHAFHKHKARNKWWPRVRGVKMNAVDHPFGGKQHHGAKTRKGKGGSPGQHVGSFGSKRTGRKNK